MLHTVYFLLTDSIIGGVIAAVTTIVLILFVMVAVICIYKSKCYCNKALVYVHTYFLKK